MSGHCCACGKPMAGTITFGTFHRSCLEQLVEDQNRRLAQVSPRNGR